MPESHLRVRVQNFKSIQDVEVDLRSGLNILIGPNGAGKSNFLASLKFIRDFVLHGAARAVAFAGGPRSVYSRDADHVVVTITMDYGNRTIRRRQTPVTLTWAFSIAQSADQVPVVRSESVRLSAPKVDRTVELFAITRDHTNGGKREKTLPSEEVAGRNLFQGWEVGSGSRKERLDRLSKYLDELFKVTKGDTDHSLIPTLGRIDNRFIDLTNLLWGLNEYHILPDVARAPGEPSPYAHLRADGAGMSEVVHALTEGLFYKLEDTRPIDVDYVALRHRGYQRRFYSPADYMLYPRSKRQSRSIEAALESIQEGLVAAVKPIDGITTQLDHNTGKRFVVFTAGQNKFLPSEVSDGTIKWLCILISLHVPKSSVYLLEEPENFLHPWMQQRLVATMRTQAKDSHTIFFLTSHSTTVLNSATPEEILIVTQTAKGTQVDRIRNREEIEHALADSQFGLGDLWVSGAIDGVPQ